ncbi:hypothetical protein ABMA28_017376 [Loxostege sticticalis]|uniref:Uncharacterized protein n=1 Tax=Loxostege sticticalis TaxID=481309 RepID=A0ABD0S4M4_LOXSC
MIQCNTCEQINNRSNRRLVLSLALYLYRHSGDPRHVARSKMELSAVTVSSRIPEFWRDQPRLWFVQCEAILGPQRLIDEARYNLVPPESGKFDALKTRLIAFYDESEMRQFQKLLSEMELGNQKPSQLMRRMRDLAREKIPDETLQIMWKGQLFSSVRAMLAISDVKYLDKLAAIADKVMETSRSVHISEVQTQPTTSSNGDQAFILAEIAKQTMKINDMERSRNTYKNFNNYRKRWQSRSTSRGRNQSRRTPESPNWLCY